MAGALAGVDAGEEGDAGDGRRGPARPGRTGSSQTRSELARVTCGGGGDRRRGARLTGGDRITPAMLEGAEELIAAAEQYKVGLAP